LAKPKIVTAEEWQQARDDLRRIWEGELAHEFGEDRVIDFLRLRVRGALTQIGPYEIDRRNWNWDEIGNNPFFCPDAKTARVWADFLDQVRKKGSSAGAIIEVIAEGTPPGLGAPLYAKLDQDIARAAQLGRTGELRRLYTEGIALAQNRPWNADVEFASSLALQTDHVFVDPASPQFPAYRQLQLKAADRDGGVLKRLKGLLPVEVATDRRDLATAAFGFAGATERVGGSRVFSLKERATCRVDRSGSTIASTVISPTIIRPNMRCSPSCAS
jgi:hypothetical protein